MISACLGGKFGLKLGCQAGESKVVGFDTGGSFRLRDVVEKITSESLLPTAQEAAVACNYVEVCLATPCTCLIMPETHTLHNPGEVVGVESCMFLVSLSFTSTSFLKQHGQMRVLDLSSQAAAAECLCSVLSIDEDIARVARYLKSNSYFVWYWKALATQISSEESATFISFQPGCFFRFRSWPEKSTDSFILNASRMV